MVFRVAGRVSPRQATSFLARARKDAKKACCAASIPAVKLAARPAGAALKQLRRAWMGEGLLDQRLRFFLMPLKSGFFACCKASEEVIPQQLNRKGATVFNIASATRLTHRGCPSAAPKGREASFTVQKLRSTPSLLTFLRGQESQSPAGARPGQRKINQRRKLPPQANIKSQRTKALKLNNHQRNQLSFQEEPPVFSHCPNACTRTASTACPIAAPCFPAATACAAIGPVATPSATASACAKRPRCG